MAKDIHVRLHTHGLCLAYQMIKKASPPALLKNIVFNGCIFTFRFM
jgi:hypothetical protein